jgi:hypothetical protein
MIPEYYDIAMSYKTLVEDDRSLLWRPCTSMKDSPFPARRALRSTASRPAEQVKINWKEY